ncbi:short chain oxidoreductase [Candidatus Vecturithrix granuli]|uniref:Short chain oxidoreductase n=1 Tax=Vecturithrix granuli TaxID=1499967 RepID=A0A081C320_VECG1|nr:short chain oxidoreductase [Candidatus Vecturithrix granuli]
MTQVVLVTGSNSGFGRRIVHTLAKNGYIVFASMRNTRGKNADAARELDLWAQQENMDIRVLDLDVTDDDLVIQAVTQVIEQAGRIDVVVNNVGVACSGVIEAFTIAQAKAVFDVNVFGLLRVNKAVLPFMRQQKSGLLIHISSIFGRLSMPFSGLYSASKFVVEGLVEAYQHELRSAGIEAILIEPGPFPTEHGAKIVFPEDTQIQHDYGEPVAHKIREHGNTFVKLFSGPRAPDPQRIADAVNALVQMSPGTRPLRTVIDDYSGQYIETVNAATEQCQQDYLRQYGLV